MAIRVCVLTSAHPPSDVRIFHKECKSLARQGYEVTLVAPGAKLGLCEGIQMRPVPVYAHRLDRVMWGSLAVYRQARLENADIYHFHDPELIPVGLLLRLAGKKVVYDVHEDLPRTFSYKSYLPRVLRTAASKLAEVIENSTSRLFSALILANPAVVERFSRVNQRSAVVHNYPKIEEIQSPPQGSRSTYQQKRDFLYVGMRITCARGAEEMIKAIGLLPSHLNARLKLVGAWDPPTLPAALSKVPGWERTDYFGLLGRSEVAGVLHQALAGLVVLHPEPNYVAAEPVKLFEYMCAGIPAIVADFPAYREIVERAGCGILVNPLDPEEIARAMTYLSTNTAEAEAMGRRGFEAVQREYNWAREEVALFQIYRHLSGPATGRLAGTADSRSSA